MDKFENMSKEQTLLILLSRLTFKEEEKIQVTKLVNEGYVDWFEVFKLTLYHKTATLCWENLKKIVPEIKLPKYLDELIGNVYYCNCVKNMEYEKEKNELMNKCKKYNINCIPVKGIYLIKHMYKDYGVRYSGDMDFLVKRSEIKILEDVMEEMGYVYGNYDYNENIIKRISRAEKIKWKLYMSNLPPFVKIVNKELVRYFKMDFRYSLDDRLDEEPINEIIDEADKNGTISKAHYLVHLCTHFYNEAKHSASIVASKDVNMIKLCDIREFFIKYITKEDIEKTIVFSEKYGFEEALFYTCYCLREIYSDGYEEKIMNSLHIKDNNFLFTYGDNTLENTKRLEKTFLERVLECGSKDAVKEVPKHFVDINRRSDIKS